MGFPFAAVDWGTTNFRLWIVDGHGKSTHAVHSPQGMKLVGVNGPAAFGAILDRHLEEAGARSIERVVMCGMVGARGGWQEISYLPTPAPLDRISAHAERVAAGARDVRIVPGLCQRETGEPDVMRGEETQLLGAAAGGRKDGLFCIPGTHSKWISMRNAVVQRFHTSMTGELFELLRTRSVLAQFMSEPLLPVANHPQFADAVGEILDRPWSLSTALFSIRAAGLLGAGDTAGASARLSGLLIGSELAAARQAFATGEVKLIASGAIRDAYSAALAIAAFKVVALDPGDLALAGLTQVARNIWSATDRRVASA